MAGGASLAAALGRSAQRRAMVGPTDVTPPLAGKIPRIPIRAKRSRQPQKQHVLLTACGSRLEAAPRFSGTYSWRAHAAARRVAW